MTPQFQDMVDACVRDRPRYGLESIALAQWVIESGRGSSDLAQQHLNFGGLKWRSDRMAGVDGVAAVWMVTPSEPAGANWTKCRDFTAWFDAYWAFIERGPYEDPADYVNDPRGYLEMLHRCGYATDPTYVDKVWSVHPEAIEMLSESAERQGIDPGDPGGGQRPMTFKLAIVVGHNATQPGAYSQALGIAEFPYNSDIAERMKGKAPEFNIEARTFFREYRGDGYSAEIRRCYDHVNAWNPALCMELHFNGAGASANGTETLYYNGSTKGRTFANHVQQELLASFGLRNRGLKPLSPGDNGYGSVSAAKAPAILTEPFFGSNTGDCAAVQGREEVLALSYLRGARDAAAELGLVAERPPIEPPPPTEPPPTCPPTEEVLRLASVEQLAAELANRPEIESSLVLSRKLQSGGAINLRARGERPARSAAEPARMPPPPAPLPTDPPI